MVTALHLMPHPFGVSPIGGAALYAGAYGNPSGMVGSTDPGIRRRPFRCTHHD